VKEGESLYVCLPCDVILYMHECVRAILHHKADLSSLVIKSM